jgi:hypothetical protein
MRRALLACFVLVAACRRAPQPEVRADPAPNIPAEERTACAVIERSQRDAIARLKSDAGAELNGLLEKLPKRFGRCLPSTRGAFGFVLDELCIEPTKFDDGHPDADVLGRWHFVHVDGEGHLTKYGFSTGGIGACDGHINHLDPMTIVGTKQAPEAWVVAQEPVLFDYDGDGEKEVLVDLTSHVVQDAPESGDLSRFTTFEVRLLTFRDGAIKPLPSTTALFLDGTARDLDGDGRPDLRVDRPLSTASDRLWTEIPLDFYAHSLPGGSFSLDDAVALQATRASCGSRGTALIAKDPNRTIANVVCARLEGTSLETLTATLASECAKDAACEKLAAQCIKAVGAL